MRRDLRLCLGASEPLQAGEAVLPVISSAVLPPCAAAVNSTEEQFVFISARELQKNPAVTSHFSGEFKVSV